MNEICPSCGFEGFQSDGPTHAYLTVSASCWAQFNQSMVLHYSDVRFWPAHQLLTDAYCVQHSPGEDRRAIQSAAIHLAALVWQIENPQTTNDETVRLRKAMAQWDSYPTVSSYPKASSTIAAVSVSDDPGPHLETTRAYAEAVYQDWGEHHDLARDMIARALQ